MSHNGTDNEETCRNEITGKKRYLSVKRRQTNDTLALNNEGKKQKKVCAISVALTEQYTSVLLENVIKLCKCRKCKKLKEERRKISFWKKRIDDNDKSTVLFSTRYRSV